MMYLSLIGIHVNRYNSILTMYTIAMRIQCEFLSISASMWDCQLIVVSLAPIPDSVTKHCTSRLILHLRPYVRESNTFSGGKTTMFSELTYAENISMVHGTEFDDLSP